MRLNALRESLIVMAVFGSGVCGGAEIAAASETIPSTATLAAQLPVARQFTVASAGQVSITLSDLRSPSALVDLRVVVSRGATKVASLTAAGTTQFAATAGTYKVQVIGTPGASPPAGTFNVEIRAVAGNSVLLQFSDGIDAPVAGNPAQSTLQKTLTLPQAGTYQVTLRDIAFPNALASVSAFVVQQGSILLNQSGPCAISVCSWTFTATQAGSADLVISATGASADSAGLYALTITAPGGNPIEANAYPVGLLPTPLDVTLPQAGDYSMTLTDIANPVPLANLRALLVQGATVLGSASGSSTVTATGGVAGAARLFTLSRAGTGGAGAYSLRLLRSGQSIFSDARVLPAGFDVALNTGGFRYTTNIATAGSYRLTLRDQQFPSAFVALRALVVQNGAIVQGIVAPGSATFSLAEGPVFLLVTGVIAPGTNSLLGLALEQVAGASALLTQAQGVGGLFSTQSVTIPASGSHDLLIADLAFPAAFQDLAIAVTRGTDLIGQIFGGGQIRFNAQPGTYSINLLARPGTNAQYGTWGFNLETTPPAPTVTLTAAPISVPSQGTATLTWSATNATACTATDGWSGAKTLAGSAPSGALTTNTTFTLTCVGPGGSTVSSASVSIAPPQTSGGGGGGGRIDLLLLLLTAASWITRQARVSRTY